jgi:hypothetical protein
MYKKGIIINSIIEKKMKNLFVVIISLLSISVANAWNVDCGGKALYYDNGVMMLTSSGSMYYKNGTALLTSSGSAYYDSGTTLKTSSDTLYFKSGITLKTSSGTYYHDNGIVSRSSSGTLYRPNGTRTTFPFDVPLALGAGVSGKLHVGGAGNEYSETDMDITVDLGNNEKMELRITADGVSCFQRSSSSTTTVRGRAGTAIIHLNPRFSKEQVRDAIQKALDSL